MTTLEAIGNRHAVRQYLERPIEEAVVARLNAEIEACNVAGGLHMQLVTNEPDAFGKSMMAKYGKFSGVTNYIALVGPKGKLSSERLGSKGEEVAMKGKGLDERLGYYGERVVLLAQMLGLNTCWIGMTYKVIPGAFKVDEGEKLEGVIAIGYGATQGVDHKRKTAAEVSDLNDGSPMWYRNGVKAALLAPTAMNMQRFKFRLCGDKVEAKAGFGSYAEMDLGIAKYHFEVGSGRGHDVWK